ncbi:MAG: transporter substrate-binding domain-containing protein [Deltaproteobacteria bacterium]|jgi:cytidine deaminase|nr:transporter substrate-binding domain-containing protein [Deltaproteobacteria bacterium]
MNRKVFFIALSLFFGLAAWPSPAETAQQPLRVVYGFDREFPPFSFEDPGGKPVGFEVELLEAVFKNSATLVLRPLQWDLIPVELAAGNITVTSGMVKTEERSKLFQFAARPSFVLQIRLFTKTVNRYPNLTFLRGQRVSVEQGSYQHRLLENFGGINIKPFKDKINPLKALYNEEVEAYCGPVQNAYYYMNKLNYGGISTLGTPLGITELRFAVNRDRGDIARMLDAGLRQLAESGEYDRIYRKWFVRDLTADESLKLLNMAKEGTLSAYTPYTRQTRGAALLTATGQLYRGSAVENANKALSVSALTAALTSAVGNGDLEIRAAICVDADGKTVPLSLAELTLLNEFGRGILSLNFNEGGLIEGRMVSELLPAAQAEAAQRKGP